MIVSGAAGPARESEPIKTAICNGIAQADRDAETRSDGLTTGERAELNQLCREVRTLREEREILPLVVSTDYEAVFMPLQTLADGFTDSLDGVGTLLITDCSPLGASGQ